MLLLMLFTGRDAILLKAMSFEKKSTFYKKGMVVRKSAENIRHCTPPPRGKFCKKYRPYVLVLKRIMLNFPGTTTPCHGNFF